MERPIVKTIPWNIKSSNSKTLISGLDMTLESSSFFRSVFLGSLWSPACNYRCTKSWILSKWKYLLICQNMGIYSIFPNAFLLDNPTNIVLPHDFRLPYLYGTQELVCQSRSHHWEIQQRSYFFSKKIFCQK